MTTIRDYVFEGCSSLTSIVIPASVTSIEFIGYDSFFTTVVCRAENVPELHYKSFTYVPTSKATLYVPASALEKYKAADQWKDFGTILPIEE